jgi:hypothetical protein
MNLQPKIPSPWKSKRGSHRPLSSTGHAPYSSADLRVGFWEFVPHLLGFLNIYFNVFINFLGVHVYVWCVHTGTHIVCICVCPGAGTLCMCSHSVHARGRAVPCMWSIPACHMSKLESLSPTSGDAALLLFHSPTPLLGLTRLIPSGPPSLEIQAH